MSNLSCEKSKVDFAPGICSSIEMHASFNALSSAPDLSLLISTPSFLYVSNERQATSCLSLFASNRTLLTNTLLPFTSI
ncbi:hypothetical protein D3C78_562650 [compost metagenome]